MRLYLLALAFAAPTPALATADTPAAAVQAIYAPYANPRVEPPTSWERPVFSAGTRALIGRWQAVAPEDEPDDLSDGDWFCQCQDWDARNFRVRIASVRQVNPQRAEVQVSLEIGWNARRQARLVMVREGGSWKLDDMFDSYLKGGLKAQIRATIVADQALARQATP